MLSKNVADGILTFLFFFFSSEKIKLGITGESSARQMIQMKCQVLFFLKNNLKKFKMLSAAVVISALRITITIIAERQSFFPYTQKLSKTHIP